MQKKEEENPDQRSRILDSKRNRDKKPENEISLDDIPFVGGLLKGLEKFVDLAERVEKAGGELKQEGEIKGGTKEKPIRGIYGFSIKTGLGKTKPRVETFGNIKKTNEGPKVVKAREPIVDVFDEKDHISVIVELPGVDEASIRLNLKKDNILLLEAKSKDRTYSKEILLPASVRGEARPNGRPAKIDFASKEMKFRNGILELKFKKK